MTWQLYDTEIPGNQSQVLLDDGFVGNIPGAELPNLDWIGVWCQQKPEGQSIPYFEDIRIATKQDDQPEIRFIWSFGVEKVERFG